MNVGSEIFTEVIFPSIGASFLLPFLLFPVMRKAALRGIIAIFLPVLLFQLDTVFAPGRPLIYEIWSLFIFIITFNLLPVIFAEGILYLIRYEWGRRK